MNPVKDLGDIHTPVFFHDNPIRRLFDDPDLYTKYVQLGNMVADLGCGPGFYTIPLAKKIGPGGHMYAVDSDVKPMQSVQRKASKNKLGNIDAHHTSASNLSFIPDGSVDFVLAAGLLCTMASREHAQAVSEIERILKADGRAYLISGRSSMSRMGDEEWEAILAKFTVIERNAMPYKGERWALVCKKAPAAGVS